VKRNGPDRLGNLILPNGPMTQINESEFQSLSEFPLKWRWTDSRWDERLAICVSWGVFCQYWDDFCYPASDDVAIWPLSEEWFLIIDHSEKFFFVSGAG
jgi:hypothetical protein